MSTNVGRQVNLIGRPRDVEPMNSRLGCPLLEVKRTLGKPSLLDLQSDYAATRGAPHLTTSAVASVDSIGQRADAYWQVGSSNCAGKKSRSRRCPSRCRSQREHRQ